MSPEYAFHIKLRRNLKSDEEARQIVEGLVPILDPEAEVLLYKSRSRNKELADKKLEALAARLRETFGSLPEDKPISDVIPPHTWRGDRAKVLEQFPLWKGIYLASSPEERMMLSGLMHLSGEKYGYKIEKPDYAPKTFGDLSRSSANKLKMNYHVGDRTVKLVRLAFPRLQQTTA